MNFGAKKAAAPWMYRELWKSTRVVRGRRGRARGQDNSSPLPSLSPQATRAYTHFGFPPTPPFYTVSTEVLSFLLLARAHPPALRRGSAPGGP
jgi:hypothetical protein